MVVMLNPALTKELIKGKGNKYSTFLYCRFHNTVVFAVSFFDDYQFS